MMRSACGMRGWFPGTAQRGFTLLEVAVALVVVGLLSWAAFGGYETVSAQQRVERGRAEAQQLQSVLRAFALRHGRLPCPDLAANGYEALAAGVCTAGTQIGWFPYVSVGLAIPVDTLRARYAVFRDASEGADLAVALERNGDAAGSTTYQDVTDLMVALNRASTLAADAARAHLTGDGGAGGAIDCAANRLMAVAYWLVVPLEDKNGDGTSLDPPHAVNSLCAASPSAPVRHLTDDVVLAESPAQLAGWLRASLP